MIATIVGVALLLLSLLIGMISGYLVAESTTKRGAQRERAVASVGFYAIVMAVFFVCGIALILTH